MVPMAPSSTRMRWRICCRKAERVLDLVFVIGCAAYSEVFPLPVGERVRVRGFLTRGSDDRLNNAIDIAQHVIIPEPQNEITVGFKISRALRIFGTPLGVLSTINLNYQTSGLTAEIHDVRFDWHLPPEFQPIEPAVAQLEPQRTLGVGLIAPQFPSGWYTRCHTLTRPRFARAPSPLGRGKHPPAAIPADGRWRKRGRRGSWCRSGNW